jgi:hypothetical protein
MDANELLRYEAPSWTEYIGFQWGQAIVARYLAKKVNRKLQRYNTRLRREKFITGKAGGEAEGDNGASDSLSEPA